MFKGWRVTGSGYQGEETGFTVPHQQMPLLREISRHWADLAVGTAVPIDRDRARRGVAHLYQQAGLRPPRSVAVLDGPRDLRRRATQSTGQACQGMIRNALVTALRPFGPEPEVRYVDSLTGEHRRLLLLMQNTAWPERWEPGTAGLGQVSWSLNAFTDFLLRIGALSHPAAARWLDFASCGVWDACFLLDEAFLCPPPARISVDNDGRLHALDGPALAWPDGTGGYYVHGVAVEGEFVEHPERLTAGYVLRQFNLEVRRVLIDLMGHERFMVEAHPEIRDRDLDGAGMPRRLLHGPGTDRDRVSAYVEVTCPSTGHRHYLRVPPDLKTCEQAVAWTFGMEPADYHPAVEA